MSGWYKQWRDLFTRPWAKDPKMVAVYVYLHCCAYANDGNWHGQKIYRGSCPTSRAAIMEGTGLTEQEVKSRLQKLVDAGEIVVKPTNYGTIVTICDYDCYELQTSLFDDEASSQEPAKNQPTTHRGTSLYNKEERIYNNNLISPYSPYKNERERKAMVREIQMKYNTMFDGRLPAYTKLYLQTELRVAECVSRFGRQSVDLVFEQVSLEPFSMGENKTGFQANFKYIFTPERFNEYLERAKLRMKKKKQQPASIVTLNQSAEAPAVPVMKSADEYEREMRAAAAQGNKRAIWLVEQWDRKEKKQ